MNFKDLATKLFQDEVDTLRNDIIHLVEYATNKDIQHDCRDSYTTLLGDSIQKLKAKNELLRRQLRDQEQNPKHIARDDEYLYINKGGLRAQMSIITEEVFVSADDVIRYLGLGESFEDFLLSEEGMKVVAEWRFQNPGKTIVKDMTILDLLKFNERIKNNKS